MFRRQPNLVRCLSFVSLMAWVAAQLPPNAQLPPVGGNLPAGGLNAKSNGTTPARVPPAGLPQAGILGPKQGLPNAGVVPPGNGGPPKIQENHGHSKEGKSAAPGTAPSGNNAMTPGSHPSGHHAALPSGAPGANHAASPGNPSDAANQQPSSKHAAHNPVENPGEQGGANPDAPGADKSKNGTANLCVEGQVPLSVVGDAVYCVAAPGCAGIEDSGKTGACPQKGARAVHNCNSGSRSWGNEKEWCVLSENLVCAKNPNIVKDSSYSCMTAEDSSKLPPPKSEEPVNDSSNSSIISPPPPSTAPTSFSIRKTYGTFTIAVCLAGIVFSCA